MNLLSQSFTLKGIQKAISSRLYTYYCKKTGFLYQMVNDNRVFLRNHSEYLSTKSLNKLCTRYYYQHYMPKENDVVVCVGAGLGHEAIWLANRVNNVRYIGIEIQPYLYELLSNTFNQKESYTACNLAINTDNESVFLNSAINYTAVSTSEKGYIEVQSINWSTFLSKYQINKIDLLQINIEGAEKFLLPMITDYSNIKRIIISAHDFRANRGDGEQFRTRDFVKDFLTSSGYKVSHCGTKPRQMDWMFAEKSTELQ
jgi:FkbM family methyltransferase